MQISLFNLQYLEQSLILKMPPTNICLKNKINNAKYIHMFLLVFFTIGKKMFKFFRQSTKEPAFPSIKETIHQLSNSQNCLNQWRYTLTPSRLKSNVYNSTYCHSLLKHNHKPNSYFKEEKYQPGLWNLVLKIKKRNDLWNYHWTSLVDFCDCWWCWF